MSEVSEATEAEEVLYQVQATDPDLVLLDWELLGQQASELLSSLREGHPDLPLIALSGRPEARKVALTAGADEFVSKGDTPERLLAAVRRLLPRPTQQMSRATTKEERCCPMQS